MDRKKFGVPVQNYMWSRFGVAQVQELAVQGKPEAVRYEPDDSAQVFIGTGEIIFPGREPQQTNTFVVVDLTRHDLPELNGNPQPIQDESKAILKNAQQQITKNNKIA